MYSSQNEMKLSHHEQEEVNKFQQVINDRGSSEMQKQIAQAQLDDLERSKRPPPHNHRHKIHGDEELNDQTERKNFDAFHNDEAFERYQMGANQAKSGGSKNANSNNAEVASVKFNHKARGSSKTQAEERVLREEMESLPVRD
ncbi:hypothetical protein D9619_009768 [Psilocybe cf. subviscida]|uniref:Uncharacterized protein n=1 Tax=Psilocybe cf. subviscida TaxID=2480587 RepID=A0A8H5BM89_9AGAR|nr:hypothetical protein D9619_009768 [Psilocybe cf. subviscida]